MSATTDDPTTGDPTTGPPPPPPDVPPALVAVELTDPQTLRLTFTEPIAPVDTVNPKRFRLSFATGYAGAYGGQAYTRLVNVYYNQSSVLLTLTTPIRPSLCQSLGGSADGNFTRVLHLHYADGGLAQITDLAGLPLPALGEFWVKYDGDSYAYLAPPFSNFNPFLPIPCPL